MTRGSVAVRSSTVPPVSGEPAPEARAATRARALAAAVVLGAPLVLAFFSGGYFDEPRLWAGIVMWCALGGLALTGAKPLLPRSRAGRAALAGLAGLTALAALSLAWTPLGGPAQDDVQRLLLYLAALTVGVAALRGAGGRLVEPVLGLGAACVVAYGLSERLLPGLIELAASATSHGRLDQPLTYWNAMGALGGLGLVLCARMAGDHTRPRALRALAAAVSPVLGLGIYLTFSRGSLAGLGAGTVALALLVPDRGELRGAGAALVAAGVAALASELPGLDALADPSEDGADAAGLATIAILAICAAGAAAVALAAGGRTTEARPARTGRLPVVLGVLAAAVALALAAGVEDRGRVDGGGSKRLASVQSNRYDYWMVALESFAEHPLAGNGSGSFRVDWLREREIPERVADAHSLYVETASELGLIGLVALALLVGGTAAAAWTAVRELRPQAAGPVAALAAFAVHVGLDWHWEMPAVTLVALACAARVVALAESPDRYPRPA